MLSFTTGKFSFVGDMADSFCSLLLLFCSLPRLFFLGMRDWRYHFSFLFSFLFRLKRVMHIHTGPDSNSFRFLVQPRTDLLYSSRWCDMT